MRDDRAVTAVAVCFIISMAWSTFLSIASSRMLEQRIGDSERRVTETCEKSVR